VADWVGRRTCGEALTHVHLSGRLANLVYSMGVTNTEFFAHQYKPLLTLLESPADGLLIADEVGLGKTIEAGIIWTELRAREDMRRLLVVCPAMLREKVARRAQAALRHRRDHRECRETWRTS
jgi:SNF2 family DNA or RNA helicase